MPGFQLGLVLFFNHAIHREDEALLAEGVLGFFEPQQADQPV